MANKITTFLRSFLGTEGLLDKTNYNLYELRRYQLIEHIMNDEEKGITTQKYCDHDIIVSLTTYGKRIYDVAFTIESIMEQTMKANKILLWLDYSFQNKALPNSLIKLTKRGLEICFCEDLLSYKKVIPTLKKYPNDVIITIDDDILYDFDVLERLIVPYVDMPNHIHCLRHHRMKFDKSGNLLPYVKWIFEDKTNDYSPLNFFTGVGGVLYPPNCLHPDVFDKKTFMEICKYGDDIWFNTMALRYGTRVSQGYTRNKNSIEGVVNESVQDVALANKNVTLGQNDIQIRAVFEKYGIYSLLKQNVQS